MAGAPSFPQFPPPFFSPLFFFSRFRPSLPPSFFLALIFFFSRFPPSLPPPFMRQLRRLFFQEIYYICFKVLKSVWLNKSVLIEVFKACIFWVENFDARYFLGVKFQAFVFLWVRNMILSDPPHNVYCEYSPWVMGNPKTGNPEPGIQNLKFHQKKEFFIHYLQKVSEVKILEG